LCSVAPPDRKAGGDYCFSQRWKEPHANSNNHCTCAACDSLTRKKILAPTTIAVGFALTAAWIFLLGYGLVTLIELVI
jgi:hypothetical protein